MTGNASGPMLYLVSAGLLSKWGFNDGAAPDTLLDYCDERGIPYPDDWDTVLRTLVRERLAPALDQEVELVDVETCHNPIRAATVDGQDMTEHWTRDLPGRPTLTPDGVEIPMADVVKIWHLDPPGEAVTEHAARITFIPHVRNPAAPTLRDLAGGIDITEHFTDAAPAETPRTATYLDRVATRAFDEAALRRMADVMSAMGREYLTRVAKGLQAFHSSFHRMGWALMDEGEYRRHRRRCPTCNPKGHTPPAPINMREYRRRLRNRRRRTR